MKLNVIHRDAVLSEDGEYRYTLTRGWDRGVGQVLWVMLNPSTADALTDDPTIRKCMGFSARWGFQRMTIVNLCALRSTDPKALNHHPDPKGPENDYYLANSRDLYSRVVLAWGNHGVPYANGVPDLFSGARCLGKTKSGQPRHPARLGYDTPLESYA